MRDTRYDTNDTIFAVSSPSADQRVILRISGPKAVEVCKQIWKVSLSSTTMRQAQCRGRLALESRARCPRHDRQAPPYVSSGFVSIDTELSLDAKLYLFYAPHSYTGDDVVEIHMDTNAAVTKALMKNLLDRGLRLAEPGEFTSRAFLNGKLDLAQAEAVNEIIFSTNEYQLSAAEKLLNGRLGQTTTTLCEKLLECLSLIEAGLDFSGEDIEFITRDEAVARLTEIKDQLEQLLTGSIQYETVIDLPAVGIAGAPNAGKSTLLNKLLGQERSIVSEQHKTTRDVLTDVCQLEHCQCILFDCAGLVSKTDNILDELAQQAAIEALRNSDLVIFCVDVSKTEWADGVAIRKLIDPKAILPVSTKCDLLHSEILSQQLAALNEMFGTDFLPISTHTDTGIEMLRNAIDRKLTEQFTIPRPSGIALTARHRQVVTESMDQINESIDEVKTGNDEIAALMLRAAYQSVSNIRQPITAHTDEQILEQIFNRFCIGK